MVRGAAAAKVKQQLMVNPSSETRHMSVEANHSSHIHKIMERDFETVNAMKGVKAALNSGAKTTSQIQSRENLSNHNTSLLIRK